MVQEWEKIIQKAKPGAKAAADAMAEYIKWRTAEITLRRTTHPPGAFKKHTKGGEPPAYGSGNLARQMYVARAYQGIRATALVGNRAPYSRINEFGCVVEGNSKMLSWADSAGRWYHWQLVHPEHPFLEPTVDESIADGSLQEAAIEGFKPFDP